MSQGRALTQAKAVMVELPAAKTTTYNGAASPDLTDYEGVVLVVITSLAGGAGATMSCKVQDSATSGGSYADVPGGGGDQIIGAGGTGDNVAGTCICKVNVNDTKPFLRVVHTIGGTASYVFSTTIVGMKKTSSGS